MATLLSMRRWARIELHGRFKFWDRMRILFGLPVNAHLPSADIWIGDELTGDRARWAHRPEEECAGEPEEPCQVCEAAGKECLGYECEQFRKEEERAGKATYMEG